MIHQMHDHYIICGFGRVGRNASYQLKRANAPFLVLDRNEQRIAKALDAGMLALQADATQDDSLREAGVLRARGLIAALPSDAENLFVILSAKSLSPKLTIVTRVAEEEAIAKLRRAGADTVLTPYAMAGRQLADALIRPRVVEFLDLTRSSVGPNITIEQLPIPPQSSILPNKLGDLAGLQTSDVIVLALRRHTGETIFHPAPAVQISPGDCLIVMGERSRVGELERSLNA